MTGPAALARSQLYAAIAKLDDARAHVINAKANNTDIGVHSNTGVTATLDTVNAQLQALNMLREAVTVAQQALIGSANDNATGALVLLERADEHLRDDAQKLNGISERLRAIVVEVAGISTNHDEVIRFINRAIGEFKGQILNLG